MVSVVGLEERMRAWLKSYRTAQRQRDLASNKLAEAGTSLEAANKDLDAMRRAEEKRVEEVEFLKKGFEDYKVQAETVLEESKKDSYTEGFTNAGTEYEAQVAVLGDFCFKKGWLLAHRHLKKGTDESALAVLPDLKSSPVPDIIAMVVDAPETPSADGVDLTVEDDEEEDI